MISNVYLKTPDSFAFSSSTRKVDGRKWFQIKYNSKFVSKVISLFIRVMNCVLSGKYKYESQFINEFSKEVESIVYATFLGQRMQKKIFENARGINETEEQLVKYLLEKVDWKESASHCTVSHCKEKKQEWILSEILKGAYVEIDDEGRAYEEWAKLKKIFWRYSSHQSDAVQFGVRGLFVKEMLFSRKSVKNKEGMTSIVTWFQLERYPAKWLYHFLHLFCWAAHKAYKKNYGPYGTSVHTEWRAPLKLIAKKKLDGNFSDQV